LPAISLDLNARSLWSGFRMIKSRTEKL